MNNKPWYRREGDPSPVCIRAGKKPRFERFLKVFKKVFKVFKFYFL